MLENSHEIIARKVKQNNLEFLIGIFSINQILSFTKYTKRLIVAYDEDNQPIYNDEIQRTVESSRVEKIADFLINNPDAIFPTNIVIAIPQVIIESIKDQPDEDKKGNVIITLSKTVFTEIQKQNGDVYLTIIDGQHRIKGIEKAIERLTNNINNISRVLKSSTNPELEIKLNNYSNLLISLREIQLVVTFFIDPTLEFQAMIFSTINRTQKSVPQSLVYSLFGLTSNDSPQKSSLQIVLSLNGYENSPFFNRIKLYGGTYAKNQSPPLTQAMMVKSIIDRICVNMRDAENDRFRKRKDLLKNGNPELCFRNYYANDRDDFVSDILYAFFTAVKNVFKNESQKSYWSFEDDTKPTNILQTTVGYQALLELLNQILKKEISDEKRDKVETYESYLMKARGINFADQQRYPFTSISKTILFLDMDLKIWMPEDENDPRIIKRDEALKKRV